MSLIESKRTGDGGEMSLRQMATMVHVPQRRRLKRVVLLSETPSHDCLGFCRFLFLMLRFTSAEGILSEDVAAGAEAEGGRGVKRCRSGGLSDTLP